MKKHKLQLLADELRVSINKMGIDSGVPVSTLRSIIDRDGEISADIALKIAAKYKDKGVNFDWMVFDKGEILSSNALSDTDVDYDTKSPMDKIKGLVSEFKKRFYSPNNIDKITADDMEASAVFQAKFEHLIKRLEELERETNTKKTE